MLYRNFQGFYIILPGNNYLSIRYLRMEKLKYFFRAFRYRYIVDPDEIAYISKNLAEGRVAVDIGSHKGGYLYWMKRSVREKGKIYAFEPQVILFNYLKRISAIFKYKNVTIENLGVSSQEGEASIFVPITKAGVSPGARIDMFNNATEFEESRIRTTTLDKYFYDQQIFPDLIKIDVEGHEKQVLLGGLKLLKSCMPKILMECENRHLSGASIFDVFEVLFELGYNGYFYENKMLKPLKDFHPEIHQNLDKGRWWKKRRYINNFVFELTQNSI